MSANSTTAVKRGKAIVSHDPPETIRRNVTKDSVICKGCNMPHALDHDGLCGFCRRDPEATEAIARHIGTRYALMIGLAVFALAVIVFGIFKGGR